MAIELFLAGVRGWENGLQGDWITQNPWQSDLTDAGKLFRATRTPRLQRNRTASLLAGTTEVWIGARYVTRGIE